MRTCSGLGVYLHSNMVRFIIPKLYLSKNCIDEIYIPIWLDLLFETNPPNRDPRSEIYIPIWLDLLFLIFNILL